MDGAPLKIKMKLREVAFGRRIETDLVVSLRFYVLWVLCANDGASITTAYGIYVCIGRCCALLLWGCVCYAIVIVICGL